MYFASRLQAGRMLAAQLKDKYRYENCAVVALDDGGVMVGAQIAAELHCVLMLMITAQIHLPREPDAIAGITSGGAIAYNDADYSQSEINELVGEYHGLIEQEKLTGMHQMNQDLGKGDVMDKTLLKGHNVILVSDGLETGFPLDMVTEMLKPIAIEHLIVATPLASVPAVDRMHVMADDIYCLNVVADYISTDHYYEKQDVPDHAKAIEIIERIILNWK
jgi:putative phosphoribosyl transferase